MAVRPVVLPGSGSLVLDLGVLAAFVSELIKHRTAAIAGLTAHERTADPDVSGPGWLLRRRTVRWMVQAAGAAPASPAR